MPLSGTAEAVPFPKHDPCKTPAHHFGGCVISIAQIAAGRMYMDAR